jgi:hypothetical protein
MCALENGLAAGRLAVALCVISGCALFNCTVTAAADSASAGDAWNDYVYAVDGFAISAPVAPILEKQNIHAANGTTEGRMYAIQTGDDNAFIVSVIARGDADQRSDQQVLDEARMGALRRANAIVLVQSNISLGPYRGSQIDLETQNGEAAGTNKRIRDRFFVVGRRLYQLMAVAPTGEPLPVGTGRWFDSFRLVGEGNR